MWAAVSRANGGPGCQPEHDRLVSQGPTGCLPSAKAGRKADTPQRPQAVHRRPSRITARGPRCTHAQRTCFSASAASLSASSSSGVLALLSAANSRRLILAWPL